MVQVQSHCKATGFALTWLPGTVALFPVVYDEYGAPYCKIRFL